MKGKLQVRGDWECRRRGHALEEYYDCLLQDMSFFPRPPSPPPDDLAVQSRSAVTSHTCRLSTRLHALSIGSGSCYMCGWCAASLSTMRALFPRRTVCLMSLGNDIAWKNSGPAASCS